MSDVDAGPKPQDGWLDTWLSEVAKTDNMRLRGNAAIALATLGGPARLDEFIDLVGETAIKMREGRSGAAEAVAVAIRETERADFDRDGLTRAFEKRRNDDRAELRAARALLMPAHPAVAWWRLRSVAPWAGWWRTLAAAALFAAGALLFLTLGMWLLVDLRGGGAFLGANAGQLIGLALLSPIGATLLARLAVAGQRTRVGLVIDGLVCGLAGALLWLLPLLVLSSGKSGDSRDETALVVQLLILPATALALAAVRVFVGVLPTGRRRATAILSAIAWPVVAMTAAAVAAAWLLGDGPKPSEEVQAALSWTWVAFVVIAPAFAVGVGAADDLRRTSLAPFSVFRPPPPAVLLVLLALVGVRLVSSAGPAAQPFKLEPDAVSGPFTITNDRRFKLVAPPGARPYADGEMVEIAFDGDASEYVLATDKGYQAAMGEPDAKAPDAPADPTPAAPAASTSAAAVGDLAAAGLAVATTSPPGRHFLLTPRQLRSLCMVQHGHRRCGVPSTAVANWLAILSGQTASLGQHKDLHFYVYRDAPQRATPLMLPPSAAWAVGDKGGRVFRATPAPGQGTLQLTATAPNLYLRVTPSNTDAVRDRVVVVQRLGKAPYEVWSADDPDPPALNMLLEANSTYLVCVRMVHAVFLDCVHQSRGLLAEPVDLTVSSDGAAFISQVKAAEAARAKAALAALPPKAEAK